MNLNKIIKKMFLMLIEKKKKSGLIVLKYFGNIGLEPILIETKIQHFTD